MTSKPESFELKLRQLEDIVKRLENPNLGLEQSLEAYHQGVKLASELKAYLLEFENKVKVLKENQTKE